MRDLRERLSRVEFESHIESPHREDDEIGLFIAKFLGDGAKEESVTDIINKKYDESVTVIGITSEYIRTYGLAKEVLKIYPDSLLRECYDNDLVIWALKEAKRGESYDV